MAPGSARPRYSSSPPPGAECTRRRKALCSARRSGAIEVFCIIFTSLGIQLACTAPDYQTRPRGTSTVVLPPFLATFLSSNNHSAHHARGARVESPLIYRQTPRALARSNAPGVERVITVSLSGGCGMALCFHHLQISSSCPESLSRLRTRAHSCDDLPLATFRCSGVVLSSVGTVPAPIGVTGVCRVCAKNPSCFFLCMQSWRSICLRRASHFPTPSLSSILLPCPRGAFSPKNIDIPATELALSSTRRTPPHPTSFRAHQLPCNAPVHGLSPMVSTLALCL